MISFAEKHIKIRHHLKDSIFIMSDQSLGVIYEIDGLYDEALTPEEVAAYLIKLTNALSNIVSGIPSDKNDANTVVQIHSLSRESQAAPHTEAEGHLGKLIHESEKYNFNRYRFVERKTYISIRYIPTTQKSSFFSRLKPSAKNVQENTLAAIAADLKQFNDALESFELFFDAENIRRLSVEAVICLYNELLNINSDGFLCASGENIHQAINSARMTTDGTKLLSEVSPHPIRVFNLIKTIGRSADRMKVRAGMMKDLHVALLNYDYNCTLTLSHGKTTQDPFYVLRKTWYKETFPEDFKSYDDNIGAQNPAVVASLKLVVYGATDTDSKKIVHDLKTQNGMYFAEEHDQSAHFFSASLPLNVRHYGHSIASRSFEMLLTKAIHFAPIFAGLKIQNPGQYPYYFRTRLAEPIKPNFFGGDDFKSMAFVATSGGGKSAFANHLAALFRLEYADGVVRSIDVKPSGIALVELENGTANKFDVEELKKNPISPFAMSEWDEEDIAVINDIVLIMIILENNIKTISPLQKQILKDSISLAYNSLNTSRSQGLCDEKTHIIWEDIKSQFGVASHNLAENGVPGNIDREREELVTLTLFMEESGKYGYIFSARENGSHSSSDSSIAIYDFTKTNDTTLNFLKSILAFSAINRDLRKLPATTKKLVIIDEFDIIVNGKDEVSEMTCSLILGLQKSVRKSNGIPVAIDNSVATFSKSLAGSKWWDLASIKGIMPLADAVPSAIEAWATPSAEGSTPLLNEAGKQIVSSLHRNPSARTSMIYLLFNLPDFKEKIILSLPLSPHQEASTALMAPSTWARYSELKKDLPPYRAIDTLAEEIALKINTMQ